MTFTSTRQLAKITQFGYRRFARKIVGETRAPRVKGIKVGDRVAVFYTREDLSGGLVGEPVDGIVGYEPATATAIMRNIVLYATAGGKVASAPAAPQQPTPPAAKPAGPFDAPAPKPADKKALPF